MNKKSPFTRLTFSNYNMPRLAGPVVGPPRKRGTQQGTPMFAHVMQTPKLDKSSPFGKLHLNVKP